MRSGGRQMAGSIVWLLGVWLLAGSGDGIGRFLWAAWTTAGLTVLWRQKSRGGPEALAPLLVGLGLLALIWWWASEPGSWIGSLAAMAGPLFWGAALGLAAGLGTSLRLG